MNVAVDRADSIKAILKEAMPGGTISSDTDEEGVTYRVRAGLRAGVDVQVKGEKAVVEWSTSIGTIAMVGIVAVAFALTALFGESILVALGLFADAGAASFTLKIFYAVPLLAFLIPLGIVWALVSGVVAPKNRALLARVAQGVSALGLEATVEGEDEG